ncbi:hypothetical protein HGRIS_000104 [Hohenbuehelia grisea]|uniref:Uncharacterized protein n=1 Tax=Hohenbuehelia grisea TaxID=104357 RepID=A0ABR3JRL8_9AGAR
MPMTLQLIETKLLKGAVNMDRQLLPLQRIAPPSKDEEPEKLTCGLTGASNDMSFIQFSHALAKSIDDETLTKLEWAWGLKYYSLNVDTCYNLQTLSTLVHQFFDIETGGWFWLPDPEILAELEGVYLGNNNEVVRYNPRTDAAEESVRGNTTRPNPSSPDASTDDDPRAGLGRPQTRCTRLQPRPHLHLRVFSHGRLNDLGVHRLSHSGTYPSATARPVDIQIRAETP